MSEKLLQENFDKAFHQINHPRFIGMEAIGGEVPFYLFTYDAALELAARTEILSLTERLKESGNPVCRIDLFQLVYELLKERIDLDDLYELEREGDQEVFMETMQSLLDLQSTLVPAIVDRLQQEESGKYNVLFLHGVGQLFPFIRSHSLLNNLQAHVTDLPTVLFFPGVYTGTSLELFGRLKNDNYYRAFHLNNLNLI